MVKSISLLPGLGTSHFSESMESLVPIKSEPSARLLICFNCGEVLHFFSVVYLWEFIFPLKAKVCYFCFWFLRVPERPLNATVVTYITHLEKSLLGEGLFGDISSLFILEPPTVEGSRVQFFIPYMLTSARYITVICNLVGYVSLHPDLEMLLLCSKFSNIIDNILWLTSHGARLQAGWGCCMFPFKYSGGIVSHMDTRRESGSVQT